MNATKALLLLLLLAFRCAGAAVPAGAAAPALTAEQAAAFARLALGGIDREYPNKPGEVLTRPEDLRSPRALHPAFYGCFDWHSSVHGHWMLVRLLRVCPDSPLSGEIRDRLSAHLTAPNLEAEAAYFEPRENRSFERMYGWAWALRLAAELHSWEDPQAREWARHLAPLEKQIVALTRDYLPRLNHPVRTGVHPDTAFALSQTLDYARVTGDRALEDLVVRRAREYYGRDQDYPVSYEPSGEDFFSPGLNTADLMRRVLPADEFSSWLDRFAPSLRRGRLGAWGLPAAVSDLTDGKLVHLVGLNLSRAWTMHGVALALPAGDRRRRTLETALSAHLQEGLRYVCSGHYEGEHWLATFAVYQLTGTGLSKAPDEQPSRSNGASRSSSAPGPR